MAIKNKKSMFFTIDSLLASGIIITAILLVSNFYSAEQKETNVNYASKDLLMVFSAMTVGQVDNVYVKSLIASGNIKNTNNTILEQIGDFWAENKNEIARNFTRNLTEDIIPKHYGFNVSINEKEIYSRNITIKRSLVSSRKLVTGIAKDSSGRIIMRGPDTIEARVWE